MLASASVGHLAFAQTALPVSGALVTASGNGYGSSSTNSLGFYNITTLLDTGTYSVTASATGCVDTTVNSVHVTAGAETSNVNILMPISGGISGRVTDAVSGSPLQLVIVEAVNATGDGFTAVTDSNGNYQIITNLAAGTYNVTATFATGYLTKVVTGISVTAGVVTPNVNLALDRSAVISGTITDSVSASVLPGVTVFALTSGGDFAATSTTNSSGKYTLNTNLGTGTYNVSVLFPTGYLSKTISGVAVVAGNQYTQNIALDRSGIISGRITSVSSGAGIANALIIASAGNFYGSASTNATGYYRITDGLGTGSYTVSAVYGSGFNTMLGVSVTQGAETANVNLQLALAPSGTITGRVTNSTGSPVSSASVTATGTAGSGTATTDSTGNYVIDTGLGTGTYNVTASATGFVQQTTTGVSVTLSQVTSNVNFQLQALVSGRISGQVQSAGAAIPEFPTDLVMFGVFAVASIAIIVVKMRSPKLRSPKSL